MVTGMQHETKLFVLSASAVLVPLFCSTLAVILTRGVSFGSRALDVASAIVTIVSGLPFVVALPVSRWRRVMFGTFSVLFGFVLCFFWSLWLSCAAFGSCL
jgi:hypothetical protein